MKGYCECGCGERTNPAPGTSARDGWVKGEPLRFILGHVQRGRGRRQFAPDQYTVEDRGHGTPCWVFRGVCNAAGYASACINGRRDGAHRLAYEQVYGPIPPDLQIDHLCRVRNCINPSHLEAVTASENSRRGRNGKLTAADLKAIASDPRPRKQIAAAFGVSVSHVYAVRRAMAA